MLLHLPVQSSSNIGPSLVNIHNTCSLQQYDISAAFWYNVIEYWIFGCFGRNGVHQIWYITGGTRGSNCRTGCWDIIGRNIGKLGYQIKLWYTWNCRVNRLPSGLKVLMIQNGFYREKKKHNEISNWPISSQISSSQKLYLFDQLLKGS